LPAHRAAPDVLECHDPAVRPCNPPRKVWINLKKILYRPGQRVTHRPGGVFIDGDARGYLWAWIATGQGPWLAVVTLELERSGQPLVTTSALVRDWAVSPRKPGRRR
jgi:hypothetical protein